MRVLVLCEYPSLNGGEHSLLEAARHIAPEQVSWLFAAPPAGPLAQRLQQAGWLHEPLICTDAMGRRTPRDSLRRRLAVLIRHYRPQVVHANSVSMARLAGPVVRDLDQPSIGHLRDILRLSAGALHDLAAHRRLLAVSVATRDWYRAQGGPGARIVVAYNGVDLERFAPRAPTGYLHTELGLDRRVRLVGTIGQLGLRKGTDLYVAAARQLAERDPAVHFLIVGQRYSRKDESRAYEQRLRAQAEDGVLRGRVHFLGVRTDVDRLLVELTVYVHAARQEPLGRVLLEAAATGLPVVATDVGGTREIFAGAQPSALLVPPDSSAQLAQGVERILNEAALRHELGHAARRRAAAVFDVRQAATRLVEHYVEIARGAPGRGDRT